MVKKLRLRELCCANCAAKIENKAAKLPGVSSVSVNVLSEKMTIDIEDDKVETVLGEVEKIVHKIEPDVVIEYI